MIRAGDFTHHYTNTLGGADGQALSGFAVDTGSTASLIKCDELTQADNFWDDALFIGKTGTYVGGIFGHVRAYTSGGPSEFTLSTALAGAPTAGDTFNLVIAKGSDYRASDEVPGLSVTGLTGSRGIAITCAGYMNGTGTGTLRYTYTGATDKTISWKGPDDANFGEAVQAHGQTAITVYSEDEDKYLRLAITSGSLYGSSYDDTLTLAQPDRRLIPDTEAYQSETGITRYVALWFKNDNGGANVAHEVKRWVEPRVDASTTLNGAWNGSDATLTLTSGASFPTRSFWLYNSTIDDCCYVKYRSGNTCYVTARGVGTLRGKTAGTWANGNTVSCWADVDIAMPTLVADALPADLTALTYVTPTAVDHADVLDYGDMDDGDIAAVVVRETVLDSVYPVDDVLTSLRVRFW